MTIVIYMLSLFIAEEIIFVEESETDAALDVSWTQQVGDFLQYQLAYYPPNGDQPQTVFAEKISEPIVSLTSLTPGETYRLVLSTVSVEGVRTPVAETTYTLSKCNYVKSLCEVS